MAAPGPRRCRFLAAELLVRSGQAVSDGGAAPYVCPCGCRRLVLPVRRVA